MQKSVKIAFTDQKGTNPGKDDSRKSALPTHKTCFHIPDLDEILFLLVVSKEQVQDLLCSRVHQDLRRCSTPYTAQFKMKQQAY